MDRMVKVSENAVRSIIAVLLVVMVLWMVRTVRISTLESELSNLQHEVQFYKSDARMKARSIEAMNQIIKDMIEDRDGAK